MVGNPVDERGVGAVFQQAPHQIGQQRFMSADRSVHAARTIQFAVGDFAHDLLVQRLTHAMQALELVLAGVVVLPGDLVDRRQGVGIVRGELWIDDFRCCQQLAGAGDVRHVGVHLACVHRIAFQAFDLGALDLTVPVRALDQTDHQTMAAAASQVDHVIDHIRAALLISLDHETDAVPAGELRFETQALEQIQRQLQAIGFFGVDVQADVVLLGEQGQRQQARVQFIHHPLILGAAVAWVQCRELDGNPRAFVDAATVGGLADGVDSLLVRRQVLLRIMFGECRFTQHVVGVTEALGFEATGIGQGFADGFASDELLAHQAHGHVDALADHRFAAFTDDAAQRGRKARLIVSGNQPAGKQQTPGGGVDEQRRAVAQVRLPVAVADLVANQGIAGALVWNTQQCFGQAHQRDALLRGQ